MTRVLVTGFEPSAGSPVNTSQVVAEALGGVVLPVAYARTVDALRDTVRACDAELVICFGEAERPAITVERFALNLDDSESEDHDGVVSTAEIDPGRGSRPGSARPRQVIVEACAPHASTR